MGSDQPEGTFEDLLAAPEEQFDPEGVMLTGVLREIETEVRQEARRGRDERLSAIVAEGIAREIEQFRDRSMRDTTVDTDLDQVIIETYLGALDEAAALARRSGGLHGLPPGTGRSAVDPTVPVVEAEEAARLGVRAEVLLVGRILAERWYGPDDDGQECTEMAGRVIAGLERAGLLPEASGDRPSASTGGRTAPPEGDALSGVIDDVSERVYRQWQTTPNRDAYTAAVVRQACQEVVEAVRPLVEAAALRAYADRHHPSAQGVSYPTDYGTGIEYDTVCTGCGASWWENEGGCTERAQILADAEQIGGGTDD